MYTSITAMELDQLLRQGEKKNIIDVRETEEVAGGKIPGAIHISLGEIEERIDELNKEKEYVVVCYSGGRSAMASQFLAAEGFRIVNMMGGMSAWRGEIE